MSILGKERPSAKTSRREREGQGLNTETGLTGSERGVKALKGPCREVAGPGLHFKGSLWLLWREPCVRSKVRSRGTG